VPLTPFQERLASLLAVDRSPDSYLAGGAAMHIAANSQRYSNDLDYFHDSVERVASASRADRALLHERGFSVEIAIEQSGFVRALVTQGEEATKVEWAHDAPWRFLPAFKHELVGYMLHPVDLAVNKLLALVGRDEPRDFLDIMFAHRSVLSLGAMCWAAAGKDPGFTPALLLDLLRRRGRNRPEDFARLRLREQPDLQSLKVEWLEALDEAEGLLATLPPEQLGCLFYSRSQGRFVSTYTAGDADIVPHHGRPGGSLPDGYAGRDRVGGD
jgi:hypothetical protein